MPEGISRSVVSRQADVHPELERTVRRHLMHFFAKPIGEAARRAWAELNWDGRTPLVLDSGCGVGESTAHLARWHPASLVVGVDKSSDRLGRQRPPLPDNARLIRADLVDWWRLLRLEGVRLSQHYLLYPNPWPKIGHLQRRFHGHAVFPDLLALGGSLELRTNWAVYAAEFRLALTLAGRNPGALEEIPAHELANALTPFERKYHASRQALFRLQVNLQHRSVSGAET